MASAIATQAGTLQDGSRAPHTLLREIQHSKLKIKAIGRFNILEGFQILAVICSLNSERPLSGLLATSQDTAPEYPLSCS